MFYSYVLQNPEGRIYVGQTGDIKKRIADHNQGNTGFTTKAGGPWELVYKEEDETRSEAMRREKYLKTGAGRNFIKKQLNIPR